MPIRYVSVSRFSAMKANALQTVAMCNAFAEKEETVLHFFDDDGREEETLRTRFRLHPRLRLAPMRERRLPAASGLFNLWRITRLAAREGGAAGFVYTREIFVALFLTFLGRPFFLEHHLDLREKWYARLMAWIGRSRWLVAHVPISASMLPSLGLAGFDPSRILVLHDGVDLASFDGGGDGSHIRGRLGIGRDRFVAGYCGQLFPEKGAWFVLDLAEALPGMDFLLVGGEEKDLAGMKAAVAERRLANVRLAGRVDHAEVPAWLAACDCFLLPNTVNYYMSPLKLFEYMASRRPLVASDFPPFREIVAPGRNGMLAAPGDVRAFAATLEALRADPGLRERLAEAARREVESEFSWDARVDRIRAARARLN